MDGLKDCNLQRGVWKGKAMSGWGNPLQTGSSMIDVMFQWDRATLEY